MIIEQKEYDRLYSKHQLSEDDKYYIQEEHNKDLYDEEMWQRDKKDGIVGW